MNLYTFTLESFHIDNTRSRHEDTDTVTFGLQVGNTIFQVQSFSAGDVNNGTYPVNLKFGYVLVSNDAKPVVMSYQIFNGDSGNLAIGLTTLNINLGEQAVTFMRQKIEQGDPADYTDYPDNQTPDDNGELEFNDGAWTQFLEYVDVGSLLFPDCDGFVAVGTIGKTKGSWDALIDSAGGSIYSHSVRYPGTDSPAGCGSNSDYSVTWSVRRDKITGSLKNFLQAHKLILHPGLRSLSTSAVT